MKKLLPLANFLLLAAPALADEATAAAPAKLDSGNSAWMIVASAFVLLMTLPGLALFYGGMVRRKNVLALLMQTLSVVAVVSIVWIIAGYSLAFSEGNPFIGGFSRFFLNGMGINELSTTIPESVFVMFQGTFAIITPALIIGAYADRMRYSALLVFNLLWIILVYAPIAHIVWGPKGWLFDAGILDYAGGTVVHINAGIAGLVAAIVLGKRKGFGVENMAPHNLILTFVGAGLVWVGWFGFNAGSALAADGRAGMAMLVTHTAAATAVMAWIFAEWIVAKKPSLLGGASGAVAGLVAITPASGFVDVKGALIIGLVAGLVGYWGVTGLKKLLGQDDALDCFGVHGVCGIVGAILTGIFAVKDIGGTAGLLEGNTDIMGVQLLGVGFTLVYSGVLTFVILKIVDVVIGLRVSPDEEREGLDLSQHGEALHG